MGKPKQHGNGNGSVYPRRNKNGKITSYVGAYYGADGKCRYVSAKTKTACRQKLRATMADGDKGILFDSKGQTVGSYLQRWLVDVVKPGKAHRTYSTHKQQAHTHIIPAIGKIKLEALRKAHVDRLYADLLRGSEGKRPLAPSTVRRVHAVLHAALEEAVRGDLIFRNPAEHANTPKLHQKEIKPLDAKQVRKLLTEAKGDRFEALFALCVTTGLRQGEALGLKWSDIDLKAGTLRVERQLQRVRGEENEPGRLEFSEPKYSSKRPIGLPGRATNALRTHRKRQLKDKRQARGKWHDNDLVFTSKEGKPVDAQNVVNRHFKPLLEQAELPKIRFHDLRHSCITLLALRGAPIRDLQALAGHATAAFTLQRYAHLYDSSARRTASTMDEALEE